MEKAKYRVYVSLETSYVVEAEDKWEAEDIVNKKIEDGELNPILETENQPWEMRTDLEEI